MSTSLTAPESDVGEPAWEIARLFPKQGHWTRSDYLDLSDLTNRAIEYSDGRIELLPMPSTLHQRIVLYLYRTLYSFVLRGGLGEVLVSAVPVLLWEGRFREPDVLFMQTEHAHRIKENYWEGADLVMEVVSESNRDHDLVTKRGEYAQAGIPEYWIIDLMAQKISVLTLPAGSAEYSVHGEWAPGQQATSALLPGFAVDVAAALRGQD
jgi:Uma2 family endonuclease